MCFNKEGFVLFIESLRDSFGTAGESMVFHMSKQYGRHIMQTAMKNFTGDPKEYETRMS